MKRLTRFVCIVALLGLAPSCQSNGANERPAAPLGAAQQEGPAVMHVVLVWLKQPGDARVRQAVIDASNTFRAIDGVEDVRVGPVLPSTRPVVDSTYDVGVAIRFRDARALARYATDPIHVKAAEEVLKPHAARFLIYDFTVAR